MKENPVPLPRPPNQDLLKHEMLRKIEVKLYKFEKEIRKGSKNEEEIQEQL